MVAKISLLLAIPPGFATPIWPAAGIALVFMLVYGYRIWPGILIGSIFANAIHPLDHISIELVIRSFALATIIGFGAASQAALGTVLIRRFVGYPNELAQEKDLMWFLLLGGPISCLTSSTFGTMALYIFGLIQFNQVPITGVTWWVGDSIGVLVFAPLLLIWLGEPRKEWKQKFRATFLPVSSMCLLVILFFLQARTWERERFELDFLKQTDQLHQVLIKNFEKHLEVLYSLEAFYKSSQYVNREEFGIFAKELLKRHQGVRGLSWNVVIKPNEIEKFNQMAKENGITDFKIKELDSNGQLTLSTRNIEHVVIFYLETNENNHSAIGFDLPSTLERKIPLEKARDSGKAVATGKVLLVQLGGEKEGFVVFLPLYGHGKTYNSENDRRKNIQGYLAAGFEIQHMFKEALQGTNLSDIRLRIYDDFAPEQDKVIYDSMQVKNFSPDAIVTTRTEKFNMADRPWTIEFSLSKDSMLTHHSWLAWSILVGGLLFTAVLGAFLFVVASGETRLQELVKIRTVELRESRERFELAVAGSSDGLWDWQVPSKDVYFSPRLKQMLDYEDHEFENNFDFFFEHVFPADRDVINKAIQDHFETHNVYQVEFRMRKKKGDYIWLLSRGQALWDADNKPIRLAGSITDITRTKEIEKMKSQFLDMISHELRTPLTPIHQFTTILQDGLGGSVSAQQKQYLDIILKNTLQLQNIIGDLVEVSRISTGKLTIAKESVPIFELSEKIIQSFSQSAKVKNIQLNNELPSGLPHVWVDPIRFEQVLRNLIDNAIKFTPPGGVVNVSAQYSSNDSKTVRFAVKDSGLGISDADKKKVFDRLYQSVGQVSASRKGLGLGLYICKEIVDQHGGEIWIENDHVKGSIFYFTIPIFSFGNLLANLLKKNGLLSSELGIIQIDTFYSEQTISELARRESLKELGNYLEHCILPQDVLIPGSISTANKAAYYLIIMAPENGIKVVKDRIEKQWVLKNKFGLDNLQINVTFKMVPMVPEAELLKMTLDQQMEMIAASVQRMIDMKA